MFEIQFRAVVVLTGLLIFAAAGAHSQTALPPLNIVPSAPDELGQVPNHFVWLRPGLQSVQDPLDGQLVFVNDDGRVVGRAALPPQFRIGDIVPEIDQVRLVDVSGRQQVIVARSIDPGAVTSLPASAIRANGSTRQLRLVRRGPQQLLYSDERRTDARSLDIRSITGGTLAQAYEIGPPARPDRYIVSEEIVASTPSLQIRMFVQRYDRTGRVNGVAFLPLDDMDVVPRDFVTVTDSGELRILVPTANGVKIREIQFSPPPQARSQAGKRSDDDFKSLGTIGREIAVDSKVAPVNGAVAPRSIMPRFKIRVPTPPISRDHVLKNARAYLTVNWVMTPENYSKPGIENLCRPEEAKFWLRPIHFTPSLIGKTIGSMPYRWGGADSPESFRLRMEWGALAGDVCSCRNPALDYCVVTGAAGVDCSGFVSQAWGIEKRGTAGLLDVSTELSSIADLRPGDAFVLPGRHVRLLESWDSRPSLAYTVLESSTRLQCEGVCERTYRPSELNGYRLIRYRGIVN
jgi:hypothetical protein